MKTHLPNWCKLLHMNLPGKIILLLCLGLTFQSYGQETPGIKLTKKPAAGACCEDKNCCAGKETPPGIMTGHIHRAGEWMISYNYMAMLMKGNRTGTSKTSDAEIYNTYMMAPETMNMQMHMLMLMYGITDRLTVMAMGGYNFYRMDMNMQAMVMNGMNMPASAMHCTSSGLADTRVYGLYNFSRKEQYELIGSLALSLPTGSVSCTGTTMLGNNQRVAYGMQSGTGSVSILPGVSFIRQYEKLALGTEAVADIELNNNTAGYRFGNEYHANVWAGYRFLNFMGGSLRAEGVQADNISGSDKVISIPINEQYDPTMNSKNYGGTRCTVYAGLTFHVKKQFKERIRIQLEAGVPVYENLNGPQMSQQANILAGVQYKF